MSVLFVYNCNPLATMPNQEKVRRGLAREDLFTVVFEQVWTDTARWADLVLPATHFLEHSSWSRGYGAYVLQQTAAGGRAGGRGAAEPRGLRRAGRRLGLARPGDPETAEELDRRAAPAAPSGCAASWSGTARPCPIAASRPSSSSTPSR